MSHPNARLTPYGRFLLVERILAGYRVADVAAQLGCSRTCAYKWLARGWTVTPLGWS
jgi:transposase-like protein